MRDAPAALDQARIRRLMSALDETARASIRLAPEWSAGLHPDEIDRLGLGAATEITLTTERGQLVVGLRADPGVPPGGLSVPFNLPGGSAAALIDATAPATAVRIAASRPAGGDQ